MDALLSRGAAEISANRQWQKVLEIDFTRVRLFKTLHGDWRTAMWVTVPLRLFDCRMRCIDSNY